MTVVPRITDVGSLDNRYHLHPFTDPKALAESGPTLIAGGEGARLTDQSGKEYIDAMAGLWCVNVGYGRGEIVEAIRSQSEKLSYYHGFAGMTNEPVARLAAKVMDFLPDNMSRIFFGNSGSDANDTAVKFIWYYNNALNRPNKKKIIARDRAYHGVTVASGSLTGLTGMHRSFDLPYIDVLRAKAPHSYWAEADGKSESEFCDELVADVENLIARHGAENIAAFFAEPVMGAGGVLIPPRDYYPRLQKLLRENDILFVADEVICGFGRLGARTGSDKLGITPDIMVLAKGITSGYVQLSGCVLSHNVYDVIANNATKLGALAHGYTYSAHPLPSAAALANLAIIEKDSLINKAAETGKYLKARLDCEIAAHPLVGQVRSLGMIGAVELSASKHKYIPLDPAARVAHRVYSAALDVGLITRALQDSNILSLSPPLICSTIEIDEILTKMKTALDRVADELTKEKVVFGVS